jgi:hypothetical protein
LAITFFIFLGLVPKQIKTFRDILTHLAVILGNFCVMCFAFMEIGDFFYHGSDSSKLGLPFMSLMRFGYNWFYVALLSFALCLVVLFIITIVTRR